MSAEDTQGLKFEGSSAEVGKLPLNPPVGPFLEIERIVYASPPTNEELIGDRGYRREKEIIKMAKSGELDKLLPEVIDLTGYSQEMVISHYEEPKQAYLEGVLGALEVVDSDWLSDARELSKKMQELDPKTADVDEMEELNRGWFEKIYSQFRQSNNTVQAVGQAFQAAYLLNPGSAEDHSLHWGVDRYTPDIAISKNTTKEEWMNVDKIIPDDRTIEYRYDPLHELIQGCLGKVRMVSGERTDWTISHLKQMVGEATIDAEAVLNMSRQNIMVAERIKDPHKKDIGWLINHDFVEEIRPNTLLPVYLHIARKTLKAMLSEGQMVSEEAWTERVDMLNKQRNIFKKDFWKSGDRKQLISSISQHRQDTPGYIAEALTNQALIFPITKIALSDFSPQALDMSKWVIIDKDGEAVYFEEALDKFIDEQKAKGDRPDVVELAEIGRDFMRRMAMACEQASGMAQGQSEAGLILTSTELDSPLKLEKGGEWKAKSITAALEVRDIFLSPGQTTGFSPEDFDEAAEFIKDAYGLEPKDGMTWKDWILMSRKAVASIIPVYAGKATKDIYGSAQEVPELLSEFVRAWRMAQHAEGIEDFEWSE